MSRNSCSHNGELRHGLLQESQLWYPSMTSVANIFSVGILHEIDTLSAQSDDAYNSMTTHSASIRRRGAQYIVEVRLRNNAIAPDYDACFVAKLLPSPEYHFVPFRFSGCISERSRTGGWFSFFFSSPPAAPTFRDGIYNVTLQTRNIASPKVTQCHAINDLASR